MAEENPWRSKTRAQRDHERKMMDQADAAEDARADVVAAAAMRWAYNHLKKRDKLGAAWENFSHQALPKEANLAKPAGFSETETSNIEKSATDALEKAAKG